MDHHSLFPKFDETSDASVNVRKVDFAAVFRALRLRGGFVTAIWRQNDVTISAA
jgi:hypothetical protein